jgi:hypothetical protein
MLLTSAVFAQTDRPLKPGPDIASDKLNEPEKKETFVDKLNRYKSEGFKVAVVLLSDDIFTPAPIGSNVAATIVLEGTVPSEAATLLPLAESFAKSMNEAFATDIFEVVDLSKIPVKETNFGKVDDWAATKYKMVVSCVATLTYEYTFYMDKYEGQLTAALGVTGTEYVNTKKGIKMKYPIRKAIGNYKSQAYSSEANPNITTVAELHELVNPSIDDLLAELMKQQEEKLPGLIEKLKK